MKTFENNKSTYLETHYEVSVRLYYNLNRGQGAEYRKLMDLYEKHGRGIMWQLAEQITDSFEKQNEGSEWDGEWEDEVGNFIEDFILNLDA